MAKKWIFHAVVVLLIILVAFAPVISVMVASGIAASLGCDLDEGSVHPCMYNGRDIGLDLLTAAMMGWLAIATLPIGAVVLAGYGLLVLVIELVLRYRRRSQANGASQPPEQVG